MGREQECPFHSRAGRVAADLTAGSWGAPGGQAGVGDTCAPGRTGRGPPLVPRLSSGRGFSRLTRKGFVKAEKDRGEAGVGGRGVGESTVAGVGEHVVPC